jgi:hypothetical protein
MNEMNNSQSGRITLILAVGLSITSFGYAADPLNKDKTGLNWVLPFRKAHEKAKQTQRLLMPVAFGTDRAGGIESDTWAAAIRISPSGNSLVNGDTAFFLKSCCVVITSGLGYQLESDRTL